MSNEKPKEISKERERVLKNIKHIYDTRITIAKQGREAFTRRDYIAAATFYHKYLGVYADYNDVDSIYKLRTNMFDKNTQMKEMYLISNVYFDLAKINQLTPRLTDSYKKALQQFVHFTSNQPYQVLNAEMLRKYIKKTILKELQGREELQNAYKEIFVQSEKCFIATYLFDRNTAVVDDLRLFKNKIASFPAGRSFISFYYKHSQSLILTSKRSLIFRSLMNFVVAPLLLLISKIIRLLN